MKKTTVFIVYQTTETGADCQESHAFKNKQDAIDWERENRGRYERPLIIKKINF